MKRQRTMRPLAALTAVAGAVVLAAAGPLAGTAVAQEVPEQAGYFCDLVVAPWLEFDDALGFTNCEPYGDAPIFGEIEGQFFIAGTDATDLTEEVLYVCHGGGEADVTELVYGLDCTEVDSVLDIEDL